MIRFYSDNCLVCFRLQCNRMSGYAIVHFTEYMNGKYVMAIPESWLAIIDNKLKCFFPKKNAGKLIEQCSPVSLTWSVFNVRRLSKNRISTYDEALMKEDLAQNTSNVESDNDENSSGEIGHGVKHSAPPKLNRQLKSVENLQSSTATGKG